MAKKKAEVLKKRTWHYLLQPAEYQVHCDNGGKVNPSHKVAWSEYASMIWCFDCKLDMKGFGGIFDGPIIWEATKLILGPLCFHRYNLVKKVIEAPVFYKTKSRIDYRACPALTKRLMKPVGK